MLFQQTSAPTGWTKQTTHNNKALRCVSGSAGSGGSVGFTTAFTSRSGVGTVAATTLTTSQIPSHTHPLSRQSGNNNINSQSSRYALATDNNLGIDNTAGAGGGGSHTHGFDLTMNFDVQYVDLIIAAKD
jgi:microcystin-dependent protein